MKRNTEVYFKRNLGQIAHFNDTGSIGLISDAGGDRTSFNALIAAEGEFKDSDGNPHTFTADRLNTIANYTNKALSSGINIPLCTDHQKTFASTVGNLGDNAEALVRPITAADLPKPDKAPDLIGKLGLFLSDVVVKSKDAIRSVNDGIVKSVSMGLNLDPSDHRIVELSLVPIPAIPHMGLFHKTYRKYGTANFNLESQSALTFDDLERSEHTIEDVKEDYEDLTDKLWLLLNNIYTNESVDINDLHTLKQYVMLNLNQFNLRVLSVLGLDDASMMEQQQMNMETSYNADMQQSMQDTRYEDSATQGAGYGNYSSNHKTVKFTRKPKYVRF